jgi:hypothetical protein
MQLVIHYIIISSYNKLIFNYKKISPQGGGFINIINTKDSIIDVINLTNMNNNSYYTYESDILDSAVMNNVKLLFAVVSNSIIIDNISYITYDCMPSSNDKMKSLTANVYPNPTKNITHIEDLPYDNYTLTVLDLSGRTLTVKEFSGTNTEYDFSEFIEGFYIINIKNKDLTTSVNKKLQVIK